MEKAESLLDGIRCTTVPLALTSDFCESDDYIGKTIWANGKRGVIFISSKDGDGMPVYRFSETYKDGNAIRYKGGASPVVAEGIVARWITNRNANKYYTFFDLAESASKNTIPAKPYLNTPQLFEAYTNTRFREFEKENATNPRAWKPEWFDFEFYVKHIIPQEIASNKASEALLEYLPEGERNEVRAVMECYIQYLKELRVNKGYAVSKEWIVLRAVATEDENSPLFEDLERFEIIAELDKLEQEGYVKVAWVEGHDYEAVGITPQGQARLKDLEEAIRRKKPAAETESGKGRRNKGAVTPDDCCFSYSSEDFNDNIQAFLNKLKKYSLISDHIDFKQMEGLFRGKGCKTKYTWLGSKSVLASVIRNLTAKPNPIITTYPEGTGHWEVVSQRFLDEDGQPLPNLRKLTDRIKEREKVKDIVSAFRL